MEWNRLAGTGVLDFVWKHIDSSPGLGTGVERSEGRFLCKKQIILVTITRPLFEGHRGWFQRNNPQNLQRRRGRTFGTAGLKRGEGGMRRRGRWRRRRGGGWSWCWGEGRRRRGGEGRQWCCWCSSSASSPPPAACYQTLRFPPESTLESDTKDSTYQIIWCSWCRKII